MPTSSVISKGTNPWIKYEWIEFKKLIDGTIAFLSYHYEDRASAYRIVTEIYGGFHFECILVKDGGANQIEFDNFFKTSPLRMVSSPSEQPSEQVYDIQDDVIYLGKARAGSSTASPVWSIKRITLINGNPTKQESTLIESAIWDNRSSETYL